MENPAKMRVKVYRLGNGNEWLDQGTGHCSCEFNEDKSEGTLVVRSEDEESRVLLQSRIRVGEDIYQRQQASLIVWSEDDADLALSFQEAEGCSEIWSDINELQHYADDLFSDPTDTHSGNGTDSLTLPNPDLSNLKDIEESIRRTHNDNTDKEALSSFIILDNYIDKLFLIFETCEDLESLSDLYILHDIMLGIIRLNDIAIIQYILKDTVFINCVGMLEYEVGIAEKKPDYRGFLTKRSTFKQIIPFRNREIEQKIHHAFRLQFLRDTVLLRFMDEYLSSILGSLIFFHNIDIVNGIHQDRVFLKELFGLIGNDTETLERKRDVVRFVQQFCLMARTTQISTRVGLYRTLCQCGLFGVFEMALSDNEKAIKMSGAEIMLSALEHDASLVRSHIVKQAEDKSVQKQLFDVILDLFLAEKDAGVMVQISELIRVLLDTNPNLNENGMPMSLERSANLDPDADKFLGLFYSSYVGKFLSPLLSLSDDTTAFDRPTITLCENICHILSFMIRQHSFRSKYYVLSSGIIQKLSLLLKNRDQHLRLMALKLFRTCIGTSDDFYHRYLIKHNVVEYIIDLLLETGRKNNLVNSVCLEFFEFIRVENIQILLAHVVVNHGARIREIIYVDTFSRLVRHYEQHQQCQQQQVPVVAFNVATDASKVGSVQREEEGCSNPENGPDDGDDGVPDQEASNLERIHEDTDVSSAIKSLTDAKGHDETVQLRSPRRKLAYIEDDNDYDGGDESSIKPSKKDRDIQTPPEKRKRLERVPSFREPSKRNIEVHTGSTFFLTGSTGGSPLNDSSSRLTVALNPIKTNAAISLNNSRPPSLSSLLPLSPTLSSPSNAKSHSPSQSPPLTPLPPIATRIGIVFVKAGTDVCDNSDQSSTTQDASRAQAAMRLKSELATGAVHQPEAVHTMKRKREDDEPASGDVRDTGVDISGRAETRRRVEDSSSCGSKASTASTTNELGSTQSSDPADSIVATEERSGCVEG
ncbi:component of IIS longevity pathway SMK-1-domain-containing protein [Dissophora ornata]|nr:component of IIS longevity pathway SMK-1-domain-containing protein [Dissophora ornata]